MGFVQKLHVCECKRDNLFSMNGRFCYSVWFSTSTKYFNSWVHEAIQTYIKLTNKTRVFAIRLLWNRSLPEHFLSAPTSLISTSEILLMDFKLWKSETLITILDQAQIVITLLSHHTERSSNTSSNIFFTLVTTSWIFKKMLNDFFKFIQFQALHYSVLKLNRIFTKINKNDDKFV